MLIKAEQKYLRMSPRKLQAVASLVRGMAPFRALAFLEHIQKRAALPIKKVVKQALANARNNNKIPEDELVIRELVIGQGPTYKRFRPVSRGRAHSIKKRTSHIRVVLEKVPKVSEVSKVSKDKTHGTEG